MTIKEAVRARHMVRKFTDQPIPGDSVRLLEKRIEENNRNYNLNLSLVTGNGEGLSKIAKLLLAKGVNNYFILAGEDTPDLDEKLGYRGCDLILYAQTLGLNTWWVGGMFSRRGAEKNMDKIAGRINGIIAVGYGATQGVPHKSKSADEISQYKGTAPQWFKDGVDALLCAPTALNKQAYMVKGEGRKVSLTCTNGHFAGIDLGIGKYHFEIGAGKENFQWVQ